MSNCNQYIEYIYNHPKVIELISKIHPQELQDDLKQEMALVLLTYDCTKIKSLYEEGNLLAFTLRTIWKMGTLQNGKFYKVFKKNEIEKAFEYYEHNSVNDATFVTFVNRISNNVLDSKLKLNANDAHESIIFSKYVELRSCQKVADYFGIPHLHVFQVVKKMKLELKKEIKNKL